MSSCSGVLAAAPQGTLFDLDLEQLSVLRSSTASHLAGRITDSASAVSVVTREQIERLGLRTLAEILNAMPGLQAGLQGRRPYLNLRGFEDVRGSVLVLVDGIPINDSILDLPRLGRGGIIDSALIERVEFSPGGGSAMYGSSALLGIVNVISVSGRSVNGHELSLGSGAQGEHSARFSAGQAAQSGDWLASLSTHHARPGAGSDAGTLSPNHGRQAHELFIKWSINGWRLTALRNSKRLVETSADLGYQSRDSETHASVSLGRELLLGDYWSSSSLIQVGRFAFSSSVTLRVPDEPAVELRASGTARWWLLRQQLAYAGIEGHLIALDVRLRGDPTLSLGTAYLSDESEPGSAIWYTTRRRTLELAGQDEVQLAPTWRLTLGARLERRNDIGQTARNQRVAMIWTPSPSWSAKAAHSRTARFATLVEQLPENSAVPLRQTVTTDDLVATYRQGGLRLQGSLYRFGLGALPNLVSVASDASTVPGATNRIHGSELEVEWHVGAMELRGSRSHSRPPSGDKPFAESPSSLTKLMVSGPLAGNELYIGVLYQYGEASSKLPATARGQDAAAVTLTWRCLPAGIHLRVGWVSQLRNLDHDQRLPAGMPGLHRISRGWIELSSSLR